MPDDEWENRPLGAPPEGADQVPIQADDLIDGIQIDESAPAQPTPPLPPDEPEGGRRRDRSPYQGRLSPTLYDIPTEYLLFARAWGAAHPAVPGTTEPNAGYGSSQALFAAWLGDCVMRDVLADVERSEPEYDWGAVFWANVPDRLQQRLFQRLQSDVRAVVATTRKTWLNALKASGRQQWTYDELAQVIGQLATSEEDEEDEE